MKVKELVEQLLKEDQEAIVLMAYDEYGRTEYYQFLDNTCLLGLNDKGEPVLRKEKGEILVTDADLDNENEMNYIKETCDSIPVKFVKAIKLF